MPAEAVVADFGAPPAKDLSAELRALLERSDRKGLERLAVHVAILAMTGYGVFLADGWLLAPALVLHGFVIACLFAPFHEGVHYTAFKSRRLNEFVAWWSGAAIIWNSTWYRYSHSHHHRFCQDPARDPELLVAKPTTYGGYIVRVSAVVFMKNLTLTMARIALGRYDGTFIPEPSRWIVRRSILLQAGLYAALAVGSVATGSTAVLTYWLVPSLIGLPLLRFMLFAEHTGCEYVKDNYRNTRSTLTVWPINLILWNMPYHAMHHVNPALPFHALPKAQALIGDRVTHVSPGYWDFTKAFLREVRRGTSNPISLPR